MKLYAGPFKSKAYTLKTGDDIVVDTQNVSTNENGVTTYGSYHGSIPGPIETFSSLYAPEFFKLRNSGWIIQCPFTKTTSNWTHTVKSIRDVFSWGSPVKTLTDSYSNYCGYALGNPFPVPVSRQDILDRASDEALTRVYAKANAGRADLLIDISQIGSTIKMFIQLARRMLSLANTAGALLSLVTGSNSTRSSRRRVRAYPVFNIRSVHDLAGLWCEMRFGWRPILNTLNGILEALASRHNETNRITFRAQEVVNYENSATSTTNTSNFGFTAVTLSTTKVKLSSTFQAGILLERSQTLAEDLGLDVSQVPIALWDLVPLSFIVDRFINIGNYIRSLKPIGGPQFGGSWVTERFEYITEYRDEHVSLDASSGSGSSFKSWKRSGGVSTATHSVKGTRRIIHSSPPSLPVLRWDWDSILDLYNALDGVMLAIQLFVPRPR